MKLPKRPSRAPSIEKSSDTPLRFKPKARRVPISLVLSRMAIPIVLTVVITTITKIWKDNNKEKARQVADKNHKDRMKNDPGYRLLKICGGLVGNMLRSSGSSKNGKSSKYYFPFNKEELKASIQNKFQSWMTWDNQGIYRLKTWIDNDILSYLWNLDHWIPQNLLPYSSMEDKNFRIAWDLANLRPISAKQNILENYRKTIDKIYTAQEYKDLCILIELLKEIIDNPINKPELIIFYESMIKAKEDYEN